MRQLYGLILRWCRQVERAREPAETPLEFESVLDGQLGSDLGRDLTSAYVATRYGEVELPQAQVER